ncbi:histidine kinase [Planosporangium mesophilum]|uniref:histidine kinase n=1 Tax=Planosporangium mesophilum TaxID=689768 RepID=A0A8J3T7T2_9ACTN|nr:histidine kinase [Planosporangium mesophilum]
MSVQQKLSVLLTVPLAALVLTGVPFVVGRLDSAISAAATVNSAQYAREVAEVIEVLQQERLLALCSLASPEVDDSGYAALAATTGDLAQEVAEHGTPRLRQAVGQLAALDPVRRQVAAGTAAAMQVQEAYHGRIVDLINALELTSQPLADMVGLRQMSALDAVLRSDEEAHRMASALLVSVADRRGAAGLAIEARSLHATDVNRFRQQGEPAAVAMLDQLERGSNHVRLEELIAEVGDGGGLPAPLTEVVAVARSTATQTGAFQERVVHATAARAQTRATSAELAAATLIGLAIALLVWVVWLSVRVSRSVALPLRRLTSAATFVADLARDELVRVADSDATDLDAADRSRPPTLAIVEVHSSDEIGSLAAAFNRVQTTAARLMEQQAASRRNVAVMFANIARRTRALVARQLAFIDEFERNEQDERMLIQLYRLDHLTTRLRRSADSLLVVSGIREDEPISAAAPLLEVVRSAVAEIEGYQAVRIAAVCEVTILPQLVPDLRLLLAELLENATAFSPPGMPVEVYARLAGHCEIAVVDHGIGLPADRLAEENRRLIDRERLDVAPTSVLGLFVVGRIARRHGLRVQLRPSPGHGVSVEIQIPSALFTTRRVLPRQGFPEPLPATGPYGAGPYDAGPYDHGRYDHVAFDHGRYDPRADKTRELVQLSDWGACEPDNSFTWFDPHELEATAGAVVHDTATDGRPSPRPVRPGMPIPVALPSVPAAPAAPTPVLTRSGLTRRQPGGHLPAFATVDGATDHSVMDHSVMDHKVTDHSVIDHDTENSADQPPPSHGGLTRRVPGSHLDRTLCGDHTSPPSATGRTQSRDPLAERAELDSFVAGVARAVGTRSDAPAHQ